MQSIRPGLGHILWNRLCWLACGFYILKTTNVLLREFTTFFKILSAHCVQNFADATFWLLWNLLIEILKKAGVLTPTLTKSLNLFFWTIYFLYFPDQCAMQCGAELGSTQVSRNTTGARAAHCKAAHYGHFWPNLSKNYTYTLDSSNPNLLQFKRFLSRKRFTKNVNPRILHLVM